MTTENKEYEDLLDLFLHPGWKLLMTEIEAELSALKEGVLLVEDSTKFNFLRGRAYVLKGLLAYENKIRLQKELDEINADI